MEQARGAVLHDIDGVANSLAAHTVAPSGVGDVERLRESPAAITRQGTGSAMAVGEAR